MADPYFTNKTFTFLDQLKKNNTREWFKANQDDYEEHVRGPALEFIENFGPALERISPHFLAIPKKSGGSLFRIHRDTRFGKDKTPYKTNTGLHFRHERAKDAHAPGFYLHIESGASFMGVGIWRPPTDAVYQIRAAIDANQKEWTKITSASRFVETFEQVGESLVRPPKGYDKEHPLLDELKRKDFIATSPMTKKAITSPDLLETFEEHCKVALPYVGFLCRALNVKH